MKKRLAEDWARDDRKTAISVFLIALALFALTVVQFESETTDLSAIRILSGEVLYRDIWTMYAPGSMYVMALAYSILGVHMIVGSVLEVFIAVPVHVWAARQRECYCCRGTYTTLVLAGTVLLWAFGPGIILLYWREKYRRQRMLPTCIECGYDLRGTISAGRSECPECGAGIVGKAGNV